MTSETKEQDGKREKIVLFIKYALFVFAVLGAAVVLSWIAEVILVSIYPFQKPNSYDTVQLILGVIEGAVGAIAAGFVLFELRQSKKIEHRQNELEQKENSLRQAEFLFRYNQAFIESAQMSKVESLLEESMLNDSAVVKGFEEHLQLFINYLVYLEGLAAVIDTGVINIEAIDNVMAYRFFLALNNRKIQENQLFVFPDYYKGCFRSYKQWKHYREAKGYSLMIEGNMRALDEWKLFPLYSSNDLGVTKLYSEKDYRAVSELIYDTDGFIYPDAFGKNRKVASELIALFIKKGCGIFSKENIYVMKKDENVIGIALVVSKNSFSVFDESQRDELIREIEEKVTDQASEMKDVLTSAESKLAFNTYFNGISEHCFKACDDIYIACVCIAKECRGHGYGGLLLNKVLLDHNKHDVYLDVVSDNKNAVKLYQDSGFSQIGSEIDGYSHDEIKPRVKVMCRSKNN